MRKTLLTALLLCGTSALAGAQGGAAQARVSGVLNCPRATVNEMGGDRDQMIMFTKTACTWTTPIVIAGAKTTTASDVEIAEMSGSTGRGRGFSTSVLENGDTAVSRYEGTMTMKKDGSATFKGTWKFVRGTGTILGLTGGGTYSGTGNENGGTVNVTGHYVISSGKGKKGS